MTAPAIIQLIPVQVGRGGYTAVDRYRDFRAVFMGEGGNPEQRGRVLFQILDECGHNSSHIADTENVQKTFLRLGKWEVAQTLLTWITSEPAQSPEVERE